MNANVKPAAPNTSAAKKKRKPPSAKRSAAEAALKAAKSDQEKTVARAHVKTVRFQELGKARVNRASKSLDSLLNLANRAAYSWTDEQANQLLEHLKTKFLTVVNKFAGQKAEKEEFDFK